MKWLQRLKSASTTKTDATKPTERGFVGFVACPAALPEKFSAPKQPSANEATVDPDRWCWPHGSAMNTAEIDAFTARLARFTEKGMTLADADALADGLVERDREMDDRRLCLECVHLHGGTDCRRCGNPVVAGIGLRAADAHLPSDLTRQPQRCAGFTNFHVQGSNS